MSVFREQPSTGPAKWIDLPAATFGIGKGVRHGVQALRASLFDPSAFVGAIIVQREGEADPTIVMAHIDDDNPLVIRATVGAMLKAIRPSFFALAATALIDTVRKAIGLAYEKKVSYQAVVFSARAGVQQDFWNAARQNIWGDPVRCESVILPHYSPRHPVSVVYDLKAKSFTTTAALAGCSELHPTWKTQDKVALHQWQEREVVKDSSYKLMHYGARNSADPTKPNFTGEDLERGPALKLFDLRRCILLGYVVG
ncbi:MAG: hypothetical protein PHD48_00960 [Alphaproteobacteria bacterium]|nr:hypothetical protein [Alphaproteobacteria bacterium]